MTEREDKKIIMKVRNLTKTFPVKDALARTTKVVHAVTDVSFDLYEGEIFGLVGESGCGKTSLARTALQLVPPTSGSVEFNGRELTTLTKKELRSARKDMQIVFQDPYSSLHPRMTVSTIIEEPMIIAKLYPGKEQRRERVKELLRLVGLNESHMDRYPHEFSGGQRQRIVIARALAMDPKLIMCDEPVSALDVSVQAQILNLLIELQEQLRLTYLFISHDLSVVEYICDRVAIMFLGQMVELGTVQQIFDNPLHPYNIALLSAVPRIGELGRKERIILQGEVPSPIDPPEGCRFHTRCAYATEICKTLPEWTEVEPEHFVACHHYEAIKESREKEEGKIDPPEPAIE